MRHPPQRPARGFAAGFGTILFVLSTLAALALSCRSTEPGAPARRPTARDASDGRPFTLEVVFSSEKREWAEEAFGRFRATNPRTASGRAIRVNVRYQGSVEPLDGIVAGTQRPHVFSPASSLVIPLLNDRWVGARGAGARPLATGADPLVLSPVVIAMWRPMAEALGWPSRPIGWAEVAQLAREPQGWTPLGHPEWGAFRFGHTHPVYSNSGLISVLAEHYAAVDKVRGLTPDDVRAERAQSFVRAIESSVVHYGRSTGFFTDDLVQHGPSYLSAAVLYENLVVTLGSRPEAPNLPFPLVCVYPREGTLWADHPYIVLDAPWVDADARDAAGRLKAFLLSRPEQERALSGFGFRPASTDVALGAPVDAAHGADPRQPQTLLETPDAPTLHAVLESWQGAKRSVSVVLVLDRSGSMQGEPLRGARAGVETFLQQLRADDRAVLLTFNQAIDPASPPSAPGALLPRVRGVYAQGGTALYDAVDRARALAEADAERDRTRIHAVVVLSDGADRDSSLTLERLSERLRPPEEGSAVRVFTIGYGDGASEAVLRRIATRTGGAYYHGDVSNIRAVYDEIAAFF